jgi:hypothetical protein
MGIVDKLSADAEQRKNAAWERYVQLLTDNVDDAQQVKELHEVIGLIGKTTADVQTDAATLKAAASIRSRIDAAKGVGTREAELKQKIVRFKEENQEIASQRAKETEELEQAIADAFREHEAASEEVIRLNNLMAQHPQLLRHIKPAQFKDVL